MKADGPSVHISRVNSVLVASVNDGSGYGRAVMVLHEADRQDEADGPRHQNPTSGSGIAGNEEEQQAMGAAESEEAHVMVLSARAQKKWDELDVDDSGQLDGEEVEPACADDAG